MSHVSQLCRQAAKLVPREVEVSERGELGYVWGNTLKEGGRGGGRGGREEGGRKGEKGEKREREREGERGRERKRREREEKKRGKRGRGKIKSKPGLSKDSGGRYYPTKKIHASNLGDDNLAF